VPPPGAGLEVTEPVVTVGVEPALGADVGPGLGFVAVELAGGDCTAGSVLPAAGGGTAVVVSVAGGEELAGAGAFGTPATSSPEVSRLAAVAASSALGAR
jgi:hypothetical protein